LAYAEMKLILARLVYEFDIQLDDENVDWMNQRVFTLWEKSGMIVRLKSRGS
jgi:cytochrome P450